MAKGAGGKHWLTVAEVEDRGEQFLLGAENALRSRPRDENALKDEQIKKLNQKIDDLVLDNDILREALKPDQDPEKQAIGSLKNSPWRVLFAQNEDPTMAQQRGHIKEQILATLRQPEGATTWWKSGDKWESASRRSTGGNGGVRG